MRNWGGSKRGRSKYGAVRTANGFPSKLEEAVYNLLLLRERSGEIKDIKRQQTVVLQQGGKDVRIAWKVDFSFEKNGATHYCEAKGIETNDYVLKLKLWRKNPPAQLEIWKGTHVRPFLSEVIKVKDEQETAE
jgi:hypothetical protein